MFDDASVALLSLATGEYRVVMEGGTKARYVDTGHIVYARGGSLLAVPFDVDRLELTGVPMPVVDDVSMRPTSGHADFVVSKEGTLVYAAGGAREGRVPLWWVDRTGEKELLLDDGHWFVSPQLSPDGRRLAVVTYGMNTSVWVYDLGRGTLSLLASGFDNHVPMWTPDSRRVMFWSTRDGLGNMYWQPADGSGPAERLIESDLNQMGRRGLPMGASWPSKKPTPTPETISPCCRYETEPRKPSSTPNSTNTIHISRRTVGGSSTNPTSRDGVKFTSDRFPRRRGSGKCPRRAAGTAGGIPTGVSSSIATATR